MEMEWQDTYKTLKQKYDEASKAIELGKNGEIQKNNDVALINYKLVISLIDEALATPVALPEDLEEVDETWRMGLQIVQNLKRMRAEVMRRISILAPSSSDAEEPNSSMPLTQTPKLLNRPRTFLELAQALQNLEYDANDEENLPNVLELLFSCDGVKLYYIASNGEVSTTDESSTLRIIRLDQDVTQNLDATFFMQIIRSSAAETIQSDSDDNKQTENVIDLEDEISTPSLKKSRANTPPKTRDTSLIYPLVPGVSPCFRTKFGAFIFPDLQSEIQGAAFGIVVPIPADEIVLEILEAVLHGVVKQEPEEFLEVLEEGEEAEEVLSERKRLRRHASERISDNIIQGACMISNGLVKGTEQVGKLVSYTTPYVISKLSKAHVDRPVPPKVTGGIEIAKTATSAAVGVTGFVANKVGNATMALGKFLAPHVHAQGSKVLSKTMGYSNEEAKDKMGGVLTVAAGAVEGFGTIYDGLDKSARILGHNLSDNSVKIIEHKYGNSAASVATDTFDTVGNMINLSKSIKIITPQGLAKNAVKGTSKAVITDFRPQVPKTNYVLAGSLYPDLTEFSKKIAESRI